MYISVQDAYMGAFFDRYLIGNLHADIALPKDLKTWMSNAQKGKMKIEEEINKVEDMPTLEDETTTKD